MAVTGSPFCEHKKLRTSCAICKAASAPLPTIASDAKYVARHERPDEREAKAPKKLGGPAKPLMPTRKTKQRVTAADEARAEAWWVKK